jgi:hypothetical protein
MMTNSHRTQGAKPQAGLAAVTSTCHKGSLLKQTVPGLAACLGLLLVRTPMLAHHSFSAVFDVSKPVTLAGVITKVDWGNPHTYLYADVKDNAGNIVEGTFQIASPQSLVKHGWTRDALGVRDHIVVTGYRAKGEASVASRERWFYTTGASCSAVQPTGSRNSGHGSQFNSENVNEII